MKKNFLEKLPQKVVLTAMSLGLLIFTATGLELNAQTYCTPSFPQGAQYPNGFGCIYNFSTANAVVDINNQTLQGPNGYQDFSATHQAQVTQDSSFDIIVSVNTGSGCSVSVWIDWNNDGVFSASERVIAKMGVKGPPGNAVNLPATETIYVPASQPAGTYRIRAMSQFGVAVPPIDNPCYVGTNFIGDSEDYSLVVLSDGPSCPPVTTIVKSNETISSVDLTWTAGGTETSWNVQWGTENFNPETNTGTLVGSEVATTPSYSITDLNVDTNYQIFVRAGCDGGETSTWRETSYLPAYCSATSIWDDIGINTQITSFSTTGGVDNISNLNSGISPNGYGNFTDMIVSIHAGGSVNFSLQTMEEYLPIGIWVDWNKNGIFDEEELMFYDQENGFANDIITVPVGQPLGDYRMRTRVEFGPDVLNPGPPPVLAFYPCGEITLGETEDYTFRVVPAPVCSPVTALNVSNVTTTSVNISWTADGTETLWNIEYGPAGFTQGSGITSVVVGSSNTLNGLTPGTSYDVYVQADCGNGSESTWEMVSFSTIDDGYCVPKYNLDTDFTTAFSTTVNGTINANYTATSQTGIDGYNDLSGDSSYNTTVAMGGTVNFSHSYEGEFGITDHTLRIWVDWNNNEIFEDSEEVFNQYSAVATQTGSFDVSSSQAMGDYRMRVRTRYDDSTIEPCAQYGYGQAIDLTIVVVCPTIAPPTGETSQEFTAGQTLADLVVSGSNLVWSSSSTFSDTLSDSEPLVNGTTYYVRSENGNCQSDFLAITVTLTVNVSDFDSYGFSYYPNPVNDVLHLSSNTTIENVVISNMLGQQINASLSSDKTSVDLSNLPTGNYLIKITIEGVAKTIKVVKK